MLSPTCSQLPYIPSTEVEAAAAELALKQKESKAAAPNVPPVYDYFVFVKDGTHRMVSKGSSEEKEVPCKWYECKKKGQGCKVKGSPPIKVVQKATGGLLKHLRICEGEQTWLTVRSKSKGSAVFRGANGELLIKLSFAELLPHHVKFVIYCFKTWDHFSKTRSPDFREYIESWEQRARLPQRQTCVKILFVIQHLIQQRLRTLLRMIKEMLGSPCCGFLDDIWSKRNCKQSFACARIPLAIDGELLDKFLASLSVPSLTKYAGTIVSCSPILKFSTLPSSRHSGHVIARWKALALQETDCLTVQDVSLATEDGASNNKKSNKLLRFPSIVCFPHDLQRCVLFGAGLTGKPCLNKALKEFQGRSSKMVGSFSRSGVATAALMDAQREDDSWDKVVTLSSPNATRWLGLHRQAMRNRELQPNISKALCGDETGKEDPEDVEHADILSASGSSRSGSEVPSANEASSDEDVIEARVRANKEFPLSHRLLTNAEFTLNRQWESMLAHPAEVSALLQSHDGTRLEEAHLFMMSLAQVMELPRVQLVSGRGPTESWDEVPAARLDQMFKDFRRIFVDQANTRFSLKGTPNEHILLALKMSPFVDTSADGAFGKRATQELMDAVYKTKLRARQIHLLSQMPAAAAATGPAADAADADAAHPSPRPGAAGSSASPGSAGGLPSGPKKRQKIGSLASAMHASGKARVESAADAVLKEEIEAYEKICSMVDHAKYQVEDDRYDLNAFWADHKKTLPIHYQVYLADCGSKRASSASVESVYSGATKLSDAADHLGDDVLAAYIFCHYNWGFDFLRPSIDEIVAEYKKMHGKEPPPEELEEEEGQGGGDQGGAGQEELE